MRIPLWIGTPLVLALATADAALDLQTRAVGALTRAVMRRTFVVAHDELAWYSTHEEDTHSRSA
ncbi:hypothetical protein GCM10023094_43550 [Rhodococcus olei]|uniref:Uncharacterized protein n=1 Tax=Rhodococcus olei TaxID=2161675 RepID=A0ABP8PIJ8_9NOCA